MNKEDLKFYVLESLFQYGVQHDLCPAVTDNNMRDWIKVVEQDMALAGITDYDPQEILEIFLTVYMKRIYPVNAQTEEISKFVCEYCRQWSEMTIGTGQDAKIVRPPYVINGLKLDGSVTYDGKDYSFESLKSSEKVMVFSRTENKQKSYVSMKLSKADGDSSYSFTINDISVIPRFKSSEGAKITLTKIDGFGEEQRWFFKSGDGVVKYVQRGKYLFEVTKRLANRYSDDICTARDPKNTTLSNYSVWKDPVQSELSKCVNGKGTYSGFVRPPQDYQSYSGHDTGKAHPDTIVHFLNDCCVGKTEEQLKAMLDTFCIGIDCSGFVSRTISYVMQHKGWDLKTQFKTIGPIADEHLTTEHNNKVLKESSLGSSSLNTACSFYKLYRYEDDIKYDHIFYYTDKKKKKGIITNEDQEIKDHMDDYLLMGSRLIFRFKVKDKKVAWDRINIDLNPGYEPDITNLKPGDVIMMANSAGEGQVEKFKSGFHVAIICYVGVDLMGPYFITADSTPTKLAESVKNIKSPKYSILKSPDPQKYKETVDPAKLLTREKGNGVRYVLHRDFSFFNEKPVLAFRRPYAFDLFYRGKIK